jgi:hypothetical protein
MYLHSFSVYLEKPSMRPATHLMQRGAGVLAALALATLPAVLVRPSSGAAAASLQSLIVTAEHNTNTVNTLLHTDSETIAAPNLTVMESAHGTEDEVRNREQDFEDVTVKAKASGGQLTTQHYTVDIIFLNGKTYYRTSLQQNKWKSYSGMTFQDPFTGGWKRGRTTVSFPKTYQGMSWQLVDTSGGQSHVRSTFTDTKNHEAGTVELWISSGSRPYVVQEIQNSHTTKAPKLTQRIQSRLGPFNTKVIILPPTKEGST